MSAIIVLPPILLPYQQAWVSNTSEVAVWEKSRRIGASWCDASDSALTASARNGMDVLYIGYDKEMAEEYISDCGMWSKSFGIAAGELQEEIWVDGKEEILTYVIRYASGSKIRALSSRPRGLRGRQGKITIDEAAHHDDLPGLLKAAMAYLIWGGRVRILSSHDGIDNPFNQLVSQIRSGEMPYSLHSTTFRQGLDDGLYQRICLVRGIQWTLEGQEEWVKLLYERYGQNADEELDCIPKYGSGIYMPRQLIEKCQRPGIPILHLARPDEWYMDEGRIEDAKRWIADTLQPVMDNIPTDRRTVLGQDFGRSGDLSVIWPLQEKDRGIWETPFILELRNVPFDVQFLILSHIVRELPLFHGGKMDARGNGEELAEKAQQEFGVHRIEAVKATLNWYGSEFPAYRAAWEGGFIIAPQSEDVIADHRRVILVKGRPTMDDKRDKGSDGKFRHGDTAVAGVLAWSATRNEIGPAAGATIEARMDDYCPELMNRRGRFGIFGGQH